MNSRPLTRPVFGLLHVTARSPRYFAGTLRGAPFGLLSPEIAPVARARQSGEFFAQSLL